MVQIRIMANIRNICSILQDKGLSVSCSGARGHVHLEEGDVIFTSEYARFLMNPNLYFFSDEDIAAADFISEGCLTLAWTQKDLDRSLEEEKDSLYYVTQLVTGFSGKEKVDDENFPVLIRLFSNAVEETFERYREKFGLQCRGFDFMSRKVEGSCTQDCFISLNPHLLFNNANYIRSVILHELCHTAYHNHRRKFWQMLSVLMKEDGLTDLDGYVNRELFSRRKDYYITVPVLRAGPAEYYMNCIPHYEQYKSAMKDLRNYHHEF